MTKPLSVSSKDEIIIYKETIRNNLHQNINTLSTILDSNNALEVFEKLKFDKIGLEPLTGNSENFIEVINQCHTYLVSIMAVEFLLQEHPGHTFVINWGNIPGYDIASTDNMIIAECFAATSYKSNGKLATDLKRLAANATAKHRYEFFYDKEFTEKHNAYYQEKYPNIKIIKFQELKY